jgi:diguanylate cyclase (GGDEF)-like protein/PAS domain S-box-containing protein
MEAFLGYLRTSQRLWVAACLCAYVPAVLYFGAADRVVLGPWSVLPVALAAFAYGARVGVLIAALLVPAHVYLAAREPIGDSLALPLFASAVNALVGAVTGYLFQRLRSARRFQRECEQRYERAARGANDGLLEWDLRSDRLYASERFGEMLGLSARAPGLRAHTFFELVHEEDRPQLDAAIEALRSGGIDRIEHEHRLRCTDGTNLWVELRGVLTHVDGSEVITLWTTDVSARRQAEHELRFHAFRDALTGLPNRSLFMDRLGQAKLRARERPNTHVAVLLIDLDRFKRVNDSLGHSAGDGLLLAVADRLRACVSRGDTVARFGGDEFALLLEDLPDVDSAIVVAERVRNALLEPVLIKGRAVTCGSSFGIVLTSGDETSPVDIVRDADTALYRAKATARGAWALFDPTMRDRAVERLTLENELRRGLAGRELELFFQPIVDAAGQFAGFEALPRWHNPRLGLLLPRDFIGLAEETGLIMELGDFVLREACEMGVRLSSVLGEQRFLVHVNLSPEQVRRTDLITRIDRALERTGFEPARLCMEVTEDLIFEDVPTGGALLDALRARGIKLCMDDFGTGYSSLSYLHRFRVDFLKIETAFVHGAESHEGGVQIVRSLVNLARNLGVVAIAEGVETKRQWDVLRNLGCPRAQGFLFAEPLSAPQLVAWVTQHHSACA